MPVKDSIELGEGTLYFNGTDEVFAEVKSGSMTYTEEDASDNEIVYGGYIHLDDEFTLEANVDFPRNWTTVKCIDCGSLMPVTELYRLLYGSYGWRCPRCAMEMAVKDARG